MIKKLLIFALFFSLSSCGGFEFVYKLNKNLQALSGFTSTDVNGDDSSQVYSLLKESIGDNNSSSAKYKLLVNSTKMEAAEVIEKDATASKFRITFYISYTYIIILWFILIEMNKLYRILNHLTWTLY